MMVLPAGKPPPFLRIGMVLLTELYGRVKLMWHEPYNAAGSWVVGDGIDLWVHESQYLQTCLLAEPFTGDEQDPMTLTEMTDLGWFDPSVEEGEGCDYGTTGWDVVFWVAPPRDSSSRLFLEGHIDFDPRPLSAWDPRSQREA